MSLATRYWSARFSRWQPAKPAVDGYSLLIPVPGDLPVFLELALTVCQTQEHQHRIETLVIPDRVTSAVRSILAEYRPTWPGPLALVPLPLPERQVLPLLRNPSHNHAIQLLTGVSAARASHIMLHDADLFLLKSSILDEHYASTRDSRLNLAGVSPVWDTWFFDHGLNLVATWELCAQRAWLRSFPPFLHMGHAGEVFGQQHVFDTTLHAQALSDPAGLAIHDFDADIVHFNYVISTYRHFQRTRSTFMDDHFRLLLIRLFIDLFARQAHDYAVPPLDELAKGLHLSDTRVVFPQPDQAAKNEYQSFRRKITSILHGPWAPIDRQRKAEESLTRFDRIYL